ncbi:FxsB family cyclophane-forming radical SAM/SPASM peptide maturase [Streptomyces sp. NPDC057654]|uniref:FxsB family cyclophane-forming radical SAM/SPASM peptide maturase n=1 Tax=Streptomyces sp. NPDC057654 TaxID=3346196 RepID=UPI0036C95867
MAHPHAPWPYDRLDVAALRAQGVAPVPFRQFVLKVHSRCNLACTYCYIYEGPDSGWRDRPATVSARTVERTAERIAEHARAHRLPAVEAVLHGGEPLLTGVEPLLRHRDAIRARLDAGTELTTTTQTNATLLTEERVTRLADAGIRVGVSLDGGLPRHNRARVDHAGRPSYDAVARGLRHLAERPDAYAGILCTADPATDPDEIYDSLLAFRPPALDFLLPHANWSAPPPHADPAGRRTVYGDWLARLFDRWWNAGPGAPRIRLFEESVLLLLGAPSATEALGTSPVATVVVEADGAIEQIDSLKSAYEGAAATGLDVFRHPFDAALDHPGIAARQLGARGLCDTCRACPVQRVCGGGNYAHRYRAGSGFHHPSVYCADLRRLIRHAARRLEETAGRARHTTAA